MASTFSASSFKWLVNFKANFSGFLDAKYETLVLHLFCANIEVYDANRNMKRANLSKVVFAIGE
jgi:hypothetical protein